MSTKSSIAIQLKDGSIRSIICEWDGYISYNGKILYNNYNKYKIVKELIMNGNLLKLSSKIEENIYNDNRVNEFANLNEYQLASHVKAKYNYLFQKDNWYVTTPKAFGYYLLSEALTKSWD